MISGVLFLNQKGDVLLSRMYRDGVTRQVAETFRNQVIVQKDSGRNPVAMFGQSSFMYIKSGTIFVVAVSQGNAQAATAFQFLYALVGIIKSYTGSELKDELIRNNFVLIYELLDEVIDFGYPQNTTVDLLKMYITQQGEAVHDEGSQPAANITIQATGAISWRKEGIKYRKNELFIDVVEQCNLMVSNKGAVLRNDVAGTILVKCYLSGMPECKFGLNDKLLLDNEARNNRNRARRPGAGIEIDDMSFHQCVKLGKFDQDRTVSFVPPDGEFQLMSYRITESINLPFRVLPVVKELGRTRIEVDVKVRTCGGADTDRGWLRGVARWGAVLTSPRPSPGQVHVHLQAVRDQRGGQDPAAQEHGERARAGGLGQGKVRGGPGGHHVARAALPRGHGVLPPRGGGDHLLGAGEGVEPAAHHHGLPGAHVCRLGPPRALPQGV